MMEKIQKKNIPFNNRITSGTVLNIGNWRILVVTPSKEDYHRLVKHYEEGEFRKDISISNTTAVSLLIQYQNQGKWENYALLCSDVPEWCIETGLNNLRLSLPLKTKIVSLPHHGSKHNSTKRFFTEIVAAEHVIISSNGSHGTPSCNETLQELKDATVWCFNDKCHKILVNIPFKNGKPAIKYGSTQTIFFNTETSITGSFLQ